MITLVDLSLAYAVVIVTGIAIQKFREKSEAEEPAESASPAAAKTIPAGRKPHGQDRDTPTFGQSTAAEMHDEAHVREMRSIPDAPDDEDMILIGTDPHRDD